MKRRLLLIILLAFIVLSVKTVVYAETDETTYTTAVCSDDNNGKVHIRWDKRSEHVGAVYVCTYPIVSTKKTETGTFSTRAEAEAYQSSVISSYIIPHCCNKWSDVKETRCGGAMCQKPACFIEENRETFYPKLNSRTVGLNQSVRLTLSGAPSGCTISSGGYFAGSSTPGTYYVRATLSCGTTASGYVTVVAPAEESTALLYNNNDSFSIPSKIKAAASSDANSGGRSGGITVITGYTVSCDVYHVSYDKTKCNDGDKEIISLSYEINLENDTYEGDTAFCLQPGASGPGPDSTGLPYIEDLTFDVSQCQDQYTNKSDKNAVQCGIAQILYQTYNCNKSTGKCTPKGEYSNGVITLALRLWMASYGKDTYPLLTTEETSENPILDWIPREDYYQITADLIRNGCEKTGKKCYDTSYTALMHDKVHGRIGCTEDEQKKKNSNPNFKCDIDQAIELYHAAENVKKEDFLGGINFEKKVPVYKQDIDQGIIKVEFDKVEDVEQINMECSADEPGCTLKVRFYYGDIDVTDLIEVGKWDCNKNMCVAKIIGTKFCLKYNTPGVTILRSVLEISNWQRNNGYVRFYTHAKSPDKYQKMVSFGLKLEQCEEDLETEKTLRIPGETRIDCPCDGDVKCTDLSTLEFDNKECNGLNLIKDSNMNCIVNACYQNETYKYNVTSKYIVNPLVCTLYERQENKFYLPDKATVYAGMQFSYDLGAKLGIKTISSNMDPSPKLTSIVVQKKQVTAKINYSFWKSEYDRKLDRLAYAHEQRYSDEYIKALEAEINEWIFDLKNCNFYTVAQTGANATRSHAITNIISSASCTGKSCLSMDISYGDTRYGSKKSLTDISGVTTDNGYELYYCKNDSNTKCYEYKKDSEVEIKNDKKTATIPYINGTTVIPTNDYATIVMEIEHDFYSPTKYKTQVFTGLVKEGTITEVEKTSYTSLYDYSYPVSGSATTGEYPVKINISNIGNLGRKTSTLDYACKYQVYNRTTAYDCSALDKNGNIDLTKCQDVNYKVKNGVPVISDGQVEWNLKNNKTYGFIFRSVDLDNLFPNGLDNLNSDVNWSGKEAEIKEIQDSADKIFTDDSYLRYSYTINPQGIKEIKNYNKENISLGGYLNSTLVDCKVEKDENGLSSFKKCKSKFLEEVRDYPGVTVNKEGATE